MRLLHADSILIGIAALCNYSLVSTGKLQDAKQHTLSFTQQCDYKDMTVLLTLWGWSFSMQHLIVLCANVYVLDVNTVFPRIDAAAFIYFVGQFGAATIRGRRLFF